MRCLIAIAAVVACSGVKIPPAQRDGEWEVAVLHVERKGPEWTNPGGQRVAARQGAEIVVVTAGFGARGAGAPGEELVVPPITLTDDAGKTFSGNETLHLLRLPAATRPSEIAIPVGVAKGARLASLRIRNLEFALR